MFTRLQDYRDRRQRRFDEAKAEARAAGKAEGRVEAYQEVAEWNERRLAAEARNEPFTEPFPAPPEPPNKRLVGRNAVEVAGSVA